MQVKQIVLTNRSQVNEFLDLPFHIYRNIPQWVPPLRMDVASMLNPRRHPFYRHSEAAFFLAKDPSGLPTGRLAVLNNRRYNEYNHEKTAFFYLFDCFEDTHTACSLFDAAFAWARSRGLNHITGSKGFTPFDGMGILVKGFEHRPAFGLPYNPPYYPALLEASGFQGCGDVVSGYLSASLDFPEKIHRMSELIQRRRGLKVARYRSRRDLHQLVPHLGKLYNDSLTGTTGNVPLEPEEVESLANQLLWLADPRLIKIILKDDLPVGYLFAYPDVSAALQRCGGKLFPLGWIYLLREMKRTRWVNINGVGIIAKYRGLGGTAILFSEMCKSIKEGDFEHADLVQIGVENDIMQRELRDLGVDFYKMHRMYQRDL